MSRPTPPTRSLTEVPGWIKKTCERCGGDFWSVPSQAKFTRFCAKDCRHEAPEVVIEKSTTKGPGENDCWISSLTPGNEYPYVKIKGVSNRVARFVLEKFLDRPIGEKLQALHKCDNPRCVRVGPDHIYEGTQRENIQWCVAQGRHVGNRFLSDEQILEIRALEGKMSAQQVAPIYEAAESTIYNIWAGFNRASV